MLHHGTQQPFLAVAKALDKWLSVVVSQICADIFLDPAAQAVLFSAQQISALKRRRKEASRVLDIETTNIGRSIVVGNAFVKGFSLSSGFREVSLVLKTARGSDETRDVIIAFWCYFQKRNESQFSMVHW